MKIISSIDPQALQITRQLLAMHQPSLSHALPELTPISAQRDDVIIEINTATIIRIIRELNIIGTQWDMETENDHEAVRNDIMNYLLTQWIKVGEDAAHQSISNEISHRSLAGFNLN